MDKLNVILTGSTGMVGEGVLNECLNSDFVGSILVINRKPCGYTHPKLKEILHADFMDVSALKNEMTGYDTCLFCLGVTSLGKSEAEYTRLTYDLTIGFAKVFASCETAKTFCYISGAGTDSTEKGRIAWARVKGKTENTLKTLGFEKVYNFRPGMLKPTPGLKNTLSYYKYLGWLYPILKFLAPGTASTLSELGQSMIRCSRFNYPKDTLEVKDIIRTAGLEQ